LKRVLITGAAGLLGSHLTDRHIERGDLVTAVDNLTTGSWDNLAHREEGSLTRVTADVIKELPVAGPFDLIYHMASPASPLDFSEKALEIMEVNSIGTRRCLDLAARTGAVMVFASTSEVYGDPEIAPQPESYWGRVNPCGPRAVYDESKRFGEAMCSHYARTGLAKVRIVRFFNTFGPRMRLNDGRAVPAFLVQALRGEPLTVFGSGRQTRSFGSVADSVRGLMLLAESDVEGPVNIGSDKEMPVLEMAEAIKRLAGSNSPIVHEPEAPDDPQMRRPDLTRARTLLGYEPQASLEDALRWTMEDFRARVGGPRKS
jgi:dTDP-glucose 4,6-dehydratase